MTLQATTWQTVGPFFQIGLARLYVDDLAGPGVAGERVEIAGRVLDGDGQGVPDGLIEVWQANSHGKYAHPDDANRQGTQDKEKAQENPQEPGFQGYGRIPTGPDGSFRFKTIKPGRVIAPDGRLQAPHIVVSVFTRGLLLRLVTRIYFPDDQANVEDFALKLVEPSRRGTLIAKKSAKRDGLLEWNAVLQGADETVFFDC